MALSILGLAVWRGTFHPLLILLMAVPFMHLAWLAGANIKESSNNCYSDRSQPL
jgi:hypothetical protein